MMSGRIRRSEEQLVVGLKFKRTKIVVSVHARALVIERHRAVAAAMGHKSLDDYFTTLVGSERIDDALDYIAHPYFGPFSKVEFAMELLDTVLWTQRGMPWGDDPVDMNEGQYRGLVHDWLAGFPESDAEIIRAAADAALEADGAKVFELLSPLARRLELEGVIVPKTNEAQEGVGA